MYSTSGCVKKTLPSHYCGDVCKSFSLVILLLFVAVYEDIGIQIDHCDN